MTARNIFLVNADGSVEFLAGDGSGRAMVSLAGVAGYATPTPVAVNVTNASGAIVAANANRKYLLLINDSDTVIYLGFGAAAVLNSGIRLNANGGFYEMSGAQGNLYVGAINGIHAVAAVNKVVCGMEGV